MQSLVKVPHLRFSVTLCIKRVVDREAFTGINLQ